MTVRLPQARADFMEWVTISVVNYFSAATVSV